jgi:hypothetical protein
MKTKEQPAQTPMHPARSNMIVLRQLFKLIPRSFISEVGRSTGAESKSRTFSVHSHVAAMCFAQLSHAIGLNDVCDSLRMKRRALASLGATPPCRNTLSHANKVRTSECMEQLFWKELGHLQSCEPGFAAGRKGKGLLRRFRVKIHAVDSTTMELVAHCMDWAKHRRRKAAAKMHLRLNLHSFLPSFAIVDTAKHHDNLRAREICAGLEEGEIVIFDKAYVDFGHLRDLDARGVWWVTRAKDNMNYEVAAKLPTLQGGNILKDELVLLDAGQVVRRVEAWVEVDGKQKLMVFITNNFAWSPKSVCDLYRCRWEIEVFFKQVKQTLRLSNFLGHSANAVRWQVYTALLVYVLLRFQAYLSQWGHSFTRLFAVVRSALWERLDILKLLRSYGTAGAQFKIWGAPDQAWLPGLAPKLS